MEQDLIAAARHGDEAALRHLLDAHRADLHAHCYRILRSQYDAEDALQDALLRAWRALPRFQGRSTFRTWLRRIATNACLDLINGRPKWVPAVGYGQAAGVVAVGEPLLGSPRDEPYGDGRIDRRASPDAPEASYERREAVEQALAAAFQRLPARQRAALILRDAFGFSARETGQALGLTVASVNSALQRARRTIDEQPSRQRQEATLKPADDAATRARIERFMTALDGGDVAAAVSLIAEDVTSARLASGIREFYDEANALDAAGLSE